MLSLKILRNELKDFVVGAAKGGGGRWTEGVGGGVKGMVRSTARTC